MGELLKSFAFDRNTIKRNADVSTKEIFEHIALVDSGAELNKTQSNIVGAMRSYLGVLDSRNNLSPIGKKYLDLYHQNPTDAWRWLLTRSLWLYSVPNGTNAQVNRIARGASQKFSLFRSIIGVLVQLESYPGEERFLSYEEFAYLWNDDQKWSLSPQKLFHEVVTNRESQVFTGNRIWLGDLEDEYGIPRDNMGTFFTKCLGQTGLFEFKKQDGGNAGVAIAISQDLDAVRRGRIRFIIDNERLFDGGDWPTYIQNPNDDLPAAVSRKDQTDFLPSTAEDLEQSDEPIENLVESFVASARLSGLNFDKELVKRFVASLIAKRFVILTGLSGSGKTKLAQAFARWLTSRSDFDNSDVNVGDTIPSEKTNYTVTGVGTTSIELDSEASKRVCLPFGLIEEWVTAIKENKLDRDTSARSIRELVAKNSEYSSQLNSFETHLKALAFFFQDAVRTGSVEGQYELISVGPDWTSRESCLGYVDGINPNRYVRGTALVDLVLLATANPHKPYFVVLDEMNLSHVERYFADFLSSSESGEDIFLHSEASDIDGVPASINWPRNLFVVGTVNVDETTYTFSPKVLDRANTIEFRVNRSQLDAYLEAPKGAVSLNAIDGKGTKFSKAFSQTASELDASTEEQKKLLFELQLLFDILSKFGFEFGFRTAFEIKRFAKAFTRLDEGSDQFNEMLDAQLLQKILPRFHGSRRKLEGPLCALAQYCILDRSWNDDEILGNGDELRERSFEASTLVETKFHPLSPEFEGAEGVLLPLSFDKIRRMLRRLEEEGFASFAEA